MQFLVENSYFTVANILLLQIVGIPMGIEPAPFWVNLYLCNYQYKYTTNLITTKISSNIDDHSTFQFIDNLCTLNDGGEFGKAFLKIYPTEQVRICKNCYLNIIT